jgi:hypothetical protein
MTYIKKCRVENILGVRKVEIAPPTNGVTIGGANGSGKTSAIWGLIMALGGRGQLPPEPVRRGEERGNVIIELDEFNVRLQIDKLRRSQLIVESKDGAQYRRPQEMLDKLFGGLSFDPGAFKEMDPRKRYDCLRELVKLDFSDMDRQYEKAYEGRRDVGRQVKELEGKLAGRKLHEGVPDEEQDSAAMVAEWKELCAKNRAYDERRRNIAAADRECAHLADENKRHRSEIARITTEIERLTEQAREIQETVGANEELREQLRAQAAAEEKVLAESDEVKSRARAESFHARLGEIDVINRKVRENQEALQLKRDWRKKKDEHEQLEAQLSGIEKAKKNLLAAAPFPVVGLSFAEDGVTYRGIAFEQLSESEQWEISLAIGFALNPKGIMFMRNSGGLDKRTRARLRERAEALGVQLFLEVVDDAEDVQLLIEEGEVKENRLGEACHANS